MIGINFPFAGEEEKRNVSSKQVERREVSGRLGALFCEYFCGSATDGRGEEMRERNQLSMEETSSVFCCIWNEVVVLWMRLFGSARKYTEI